MPKRKREEEKIKKKIKKLEQKLEKRRRKNTWELVVSDTDSSRALTPTSPILTPTTPPRSIPDVEIVEEIGVENEVEEVQLDEAILSALGESTPTDRNYGKEIHEEILKRISNVICNGLDSTIKDALLKEHLIPKNAILFDAPLLNTELVGLLAETIKTRDQKVKERQQELGVAMSIIIKVLNDIVNDKIEKIKAIANLRDALRLMSDLHYQDTLTRRKLIMPNLEKNLSRSIENVKRDSLLFGEKFQDTVKTASSIKKSATMILKPQNAQVPKTASAPVQSTRRQENYRAPPRSYQSRPYKQGGGRYQQTQQRTTPKPQQRRPPPKHYQQKPVKQT